MIDTTAQVRDYFTSGGHIIVGQARPPERVDVRRIGTAYLATLRYGAQAIRTIVKPLAPDSWLHDPTLLYHVHYRLQNADPLLSRVLNNMVAPVAERGWVIVEYVAGLSLREVLGRALRFPVLHNTQPSILLAQTARALAALNQIDAVQARLPLAPQANVSYVEKLEECWADPCIQPYLPQLWRAGPPAGIVGSSFRGRGRIGDRVILIDCQPKNILIPCRGEVRFIDQDYGVGNPALGLAFFLVTLDRLGLRHPLPWQRARIAAWKAVFLESYFQNADPWIAEDLPFFYAWTLARQLRRHVLGPRWGRWLFRPYIRWSYGRHLREFLSAYHPGPVGLCQGVGAAPAASLGGIGALRKAA
jgi:hypothetical protein